MDGLDDGGVAVLQFAHVGRCRLDIFLDFWEDVAKVVGVGGEGLFEFLHDFLTGLDEHCWDFVDEVYFVDDGTGDIISDDGRGPEAEVGLDRLHIEKSW